MNYYIQGDAANADKIRAAFRKLGYDTSGYLFNANSVLYFTLDGEIRATTCNCTPAIIKTHPDYKELELPVESMFKVGDWIIRNNRISFVPIQIYGLKKDRYLVTNLLGSKGELMINRQNEWHLWTIQDAKDGDVLVDTLSGTRALTILFISINEDDSISAYCGWNGYTFRVTIDGLGYGTLSSTRYVPATKEQRDLLFAKMKDAGYEWDAGKKELRKIEPHYDISNFKPFDHCRFKPTETHDWIYADFWYVQAHYKVEHLSAIEKWES